MKYVGFPMIAAGLIALAGGLPVFGVIPRAASLWAFFLLAVPGSIMIFAARHMCRPAGIDNNEIARDGTTSIGIKGVALTILLTIFYIVIFFADKIPLGGGANLNQLLTAHFFSAFDPISEFLRGKPANRWFFYGLFYTAMVLIFGARMLMKYRDNRYQMLRTSSVMFVQLGFAFLFPALLELLHKPEFYFSYFWPLKFEYLWPGTWAKMGAGIGAYFLFFGAFMSFIAVPILTYFFGKRWYCSWVCGCGALAETMGDPFRQLSSKSLGAWKLERIMVHSILVVIVLATGLLWINSFAGGKILGVVSHSLAKYYGLFIGLVFSGVVGVGFYPLLGSRVWCRFGCPQAAILGILQKYFSRFRITVNGGQCISCGNCSVYCEMGIDVRWYAQREQNVVRASCVGCGICSAVCPRGVLRLENGPVAGRTDNFRLKDLASLR